MSPGSPCQPKEWKSGDTYNAIVCGVGITRCTKTLAKPKLLNTVWSAYWWWLLWTISARLKKLASRRRWKSGASAIVVRAYRHNGGSNGALDDAPNPKRRLVLCLKRTVSGAEGCEVIYLLQPLKPSGEAADCHRASFGWSQEGPSADMQAITGFAARVQLKTAYERHTAASGGVTFIRTIHSVRDTQC